MTAKKSRPELSLRQRALNLVSRREYSRLELSRRLANYGEDADEISAVLSDFEQRGWLSDARCAEQVVHQRQASMGIRRITQELREKGLDAATIEAALEANPVDELEVARSVWQKKFGTPPTTQQEKAKQVRFLQSRGFGLNSIFKVIGGSPDDDVVEEY